MISAVHAAMALAAKVLWNGNGGPVEGGDILAIADDCENEELQ